MNNKYKAIGLMSGTSLDGVDIAYCEFNFDKGWSYKLLHADTVSYNTYWKKNLEAVYNGSAENISETDCTYGNFLGKLVKNFCEKYKLSPDFISSHGHTVFHQPRNGFTKQIGSGAHLSATAGFPVICDFRSVDVALGGQGAPLVPIGDKYLFSDADYCLNLGGIANISFDQNSERLAFDICACNLVLNYYALKKKQPFDRDGQLAESGKINSALLYKLNDRPYYSKAFPKSLGREDVERDIFSLIDSTNVNVEDVLATFCEHIALQIAKITGEVKKQKKMLITGGGALNTFLISCIVKNNNADIRIPKKEIIEYKEAIIFAFLGVLRIRNEINCLKSVTGASKNNCGGAIYHPF